MKTKKKMFHHLSKNDRLTIEKYLKKHIPVKEIAEEVGVHISTVYREIKRGLVLQRNSDLTEEYRYCGDTANARYRDHLKDKGPALKIGNDHALANYIEWKIIQDDYSPAAVLGEISRKPELQARFKVTISEWTLYKYIDMGLFLHLTNKNLPVKCKRKRHYHKVKTLARPSKGLSIEKRPDEINQRNTFGNWEMDSVEGKQGTKPRLVVLTERLTRQELLFRVPDGTSASVVHCLDRLERRYGALFKKVFRSITVDNGSEFADCEGMERSCRGKKRRTRIYYCHPYTASERGSNENQNKLVRRRFPKGSSFENVTPIQVAKANDWINNYPRELFAYAPSDERFQKELAAIT